MASSNLLASQSFSRDVGGKIESGIDFPLTRASQSKVLRNWNICRGQGQKHALSQVKSTGSECSKHARAECCSSFSSLPVECPELVRRAASFHQSRFGACCGAGSGPLMRAGWASEAGHSGSPTSRTVRMNARGKTGASRHGEVAIRNEEFEKGAATPAGARPATSAGAAWKHPAFSSGELQAVPTGLSTSQSSASIVPAVGPEMEEVERWVGEDGHFMAAGSQGTLGTPAEVEELEEQFYRGENAKGYAGRAANGPPSGTADTEASTEAAQGGTEENGAVREEGSTTPAGFSRETQSVAAVVARDRDMTRGAARLAGRWIRKVAVPWVRDVLELRVQEDVGLQPRPVPAGPAGPSGPVPMGWSILQADLDFVSAVGAQLQWWADTWRMPLQPVYDPEEVAAYFVRRPHLVVLRLVQVSFAMASLGVSLVRDNRVVRRVEQQGLVMDPMEMAQRRKATATKLKNALVRLGPTFIKVAQSLSSRPDVIGPDTAKVLAELQDRLPPFPTEEALEIIEAELGQPAAALFRELTPTPVAAASFGQVYRGRAMDGQEVAVKVQRPRVLLAVGRDILILRMLLGWLRQVAKMSTDLRVLADELALGLYGELDYRQEASNAALFAKVHAHLPTVDVPRVRMDLTARKVMTMEWMDGERPSDLLAVAQGRAEVEHAWQRQLAKQKLLRLVAIGVESSLVQLLDTGVMHADPHPGNLLLTRQGHVAYLDFGLLTRMDPQHQAAMLAAIAHLVNAEWAALANDLAAMDVLKPTTDRAAVSRALEEAFGVGSSAVVKGGIPDIKFGQVTTQLWQIALRFRFKLPPYYTLVLRSLASLEGIGLAVDADFKVFASAYPYVVRRLLTDNSPSSREVLRQLLLTEERRFRWDRMAAFTASSLQATRAKSAVMGSWGAGGPGPGPVELQREEPRKTGMAASLMELVLSPEAASARRVLLDADVEALAQAFVSKEAAPVRQRLAKALSQAGLLRLPLRRGSSAPNKKSPSSDTMARSPPSEPPSPLPPLPSTVRGLSDTEASLASASSSSIRGVGERQAVGGGSAGHGEGDWELRPSASGSCSEPQGWDSLGEPRSPVAGAASEAAIARMQNKRLWFLVRAAIGRLKGGVVLKLRILWATITILVTALVLSVQRVLEKLWRVERREMGSKLEAERLQTEKNGGGHGPAQPRPANA